MKSVDVLIIGSGPAGKTAAIYTGRAGLKPLVLAGAMNPGGALMNTTDIENFPGFPEGIAGPELMDLMQQQAEKFGAVFELDEAEVIEFASDGSRKYVKTMMGEEYEAKAVILTPGSLYRQLGCKGEKEFAGRGVSYCATCDGFFFKDKKLVVVGGGDTAMEEAIYLTRFSPKVTIVHRREELRASQIMEDRAKANPKIEFALSKAVVEIHGENGSVNSVTLEDTENGAKSELEVEGVFVAIGNDPSTKFLQGQVDLDEDGYIITKAHTASTDIPGVFAAGDAMDPDYRQAIVAAGAGAKAGIEAERYLETLD